MNFFDTSVMVPSVREVDARHVTSAKLIKQASYLTDSTAAHALTEVYSTLTRLPKEHWVPPGPAQSIVADLSERLLVVSLTALETLQVIRKFADADLTGGMVYDGIILACGT